MSLLVVLLIVFLCIGWIYWIKLNAPHYKKIFYGSGAVGVLSIILVLITYYATGFYHSDYYWKLQLAFWFIAPGTIGLGKRFPKLWMP